jgi:proline iminopeptidase
MFNLINKIAFMRPVFILIFFLTNLNYLFAQTFPDSQTDGRYYTVKGAKLWVVTVGKGEPLFIIPGGPGSAHIRMRVFDSLYDNCMLVYYDGYGRGKSDTASKATEYSLKRDIDDLEALRKQMGFTKINVLGHSYGSIVAQGYAIRYPENVSHLILSAPFHSHTMWQENDDNSNREKRTNYPEMWDTLMIIRKQGYQSSDLLHLAIYGRSPYGFLYAYNPDKFLNRARVSYPNMFNSKLYYKMVGKDGDFVVGNDIGSFDYRKDLKKLKMPVLILAGRFDRVAVPWMMVKYKEYCPQAQFVMFEKNGHNPHVEEPAKTFELIRTFLSK